MNGAIMVLGTGSDVGKSIVATALCRILRRRGYRVAPFKAQNMSNNSFVTLEGGEIGRAQVTQAEAAGVPPSVHMNPVLLKPSSDQGSQVVLQGRVYAQMTAGEYHAFKPGLRKAVMDSYHRLQEEYEVIVLEGAGSCCEMNLKENDLVNFPMAKAVGASCILVGDIDRGGVFAQLLGSHHLMTRKERALTTGFLINKFRGDPSLFQSGIDYIEKKSGKPVLGLVPFYRDIAIDPEDSVVVQEDRRVKHPVESRSVNIGVLRLPSISNFTDLEILAREPGVVVNYLFRPVELTDTYDLIVLPGAKNVMEDAVWLGRTRWTQAVLRFADRGGRVLGICGGYQLLGKRILDPDGVESSRRIVKALGLLPAETVLARDKVVRRVTGTCLWNGKRVSGYEIHMGRTRALATQERPFLRLHQPGSRSHWDDGLVLDGGRVWGSYVHGILDASGFRGDLLNEVRRDKGLKERRPRQGRLARFHQYDRLADHFEKHCDMDRILASMG
ncbi:MAG: cobyric acid synthase [Desulfobacteraceae bacterium]|jgi:adenosylcobyric acid synthase